MLDRERGKLPPVLARPGNKVLIACRRAPSLWNVLYLNNGLRSPGSRHLASRIFQWFTIFCSWQSRLADNSTSVETAKLAMLSLHDYFFSLVTFAGFPSSLL
jgi:hypothetical protein